MGRRCWPISSFRRMTRSYLIFVDIEGKLDVLQRATTQTPQGLDAQHGGELFPVGVQVSGLGSHRPAWANMMLTAMLSSS